MTDTESEAVAWILRADTGTVRLWTQDRGFAEQKAGDWEAATEPLFPASSLSSRDARIAELEADLERHARDMMVYRDAHDKKAALLEEAVKGLEAISFAKAFGRDVPSLEDLITDNRQTARATLSAIKGGE